MAKVVKKEQCPTCRDSGEDNLVTHDDGSIHCYACGEHSQNGNIKELPVREKGIVNLLPLGDIIPLGKRNITKESCEHYGVSFSKYQEGPILIFPYCVGNQTVAQKIKTPDKKIFWKGNVKDVTMFGCQTFTSPAQRLIITEGEEDCLACYQVVKDTSTHVTTLTNGASSVEQFYEKNHEQLLKYPDIVVCMDMDEAGESAAKKFLELLPPGKCRVARLTENDPCDMLVANKENELRWALLKAEVPTLEEVVDLSKLSLDFFKEEFKPGEMTGFPLLDQNLDGIRKGELVMLASGTGLGKTTFLNDIAYKWAARGLKIADIKLEKNIRRTIYDYMAMHYRIAPRKFAYNPNIITDDQKQSFLDRFSGKMYFLKHFGSLSSNRLLTILDYYATVLKVDYILLDHISIAVSGLEGGMDGERKEIDKLLTKIRELINRTGVGFICVSHLKNPPNNMLQYEEGKEIRRCDLRGSGGLAQLSDTILAIEGNLVELETRGDRKLKILKARDGDMQETYCDTWTYNGHIGRICLKEEKL